MLTLYLLRHAKSAWTDQSLGDHERPLAPRGQEAAPLMAAHMVAQELIPERIICSTATRTRQTLDLIMPALLTASSDVHIETIYTAAIYEAWGQSLLEVLRVQDEPATPASILMIGHNPGIQNLAATLFGDDRGAMAMRLLGKYPTCALAELRFELTRWQDLGGETGRLVRFDTPKTIAADA